MAEMSRRFNFDDFDEQIAEALAENERGMGDLIPMRSPRPGEIGGVLVRLTTEFEDDPLPDPPEAA